MNKREEALEIIRIEYAKYGHETHESMRAYIENKVSYQTRIEAIRDGRVLYNLRKLEEEEASK